MSDRKPDPEPVIHDEASYSRWCDWRARQPLYYCSEPDADGLCTITYPDRDARR